MNLIENKKLLIENKKKDLPKDFLKQNLGSLLIDVNDVYEKVKEGVKTITLVENLDDLYNENGDDIVAFDIKEMAYNAELDNIAYAKRLNEDLCVVVEDILLDDYQMYLYNMFNIDGVIFDVQNVDKEELKNIIFLANVMGITLIYSVRHENDLNKIKKYEKNIRFLAVDDDSLVESLPDDAYIVKKTDSKLSKRYADIFIKRKKYE